MEKELETAAVVQAVRYGLQIKEINIRIDELDTHRNWLEINRLKQSKVAITRAWVAFGEICLSYDEALYDEIRIQYHGARWGW